MGKLTTQNSNLIVETISNINIPPSILKKENIKELINNICKSQESIDINKEKLEAARAAYQDGNFIGNFWYNREDAIQEAREDLSIAIGNLTSQSSKLIIFNTAISNVLLQQQKTLNNQQEKLNQQTYRIQIQNEEIKKNQDELAKANEKLIEQQIKINETNQGLIEVKGISQEQAIKLINIIQQTEKLDINLKEFVSNSEKKLRLEINNIQNNLNLFYQHTLDEIKEHQTNIKRELDKTARHLDKIIDDQKNKFQHEINNLDRSLKSKFNLIEEDLVKSKVEINESIGFIRNISIQSLEEKLENYKYRFEKKQKILSSLLGFNIFLILLFSILFIIIQKGLPIPNLTN